MIRLSGPSALARLLTAALDRLLDRLTPKPPKPGECKASITYWSGR